MAYYYCKCPVRDYFVIVVFLFFLTYGYSMRAQRAALSTSTVVFNCSQTEFIIWKFGSVGVYNLEEYEVLYNSFSVNPKLPFKSAVNVTVAKFALGRQSTLTVTSISLENAGTYVCAEADSDDSRVYFDLTVIDEPSCSSTIPTGGQWTEENSTVAVKCQCKFNGTVPQPEFICLSTQNSVITRLESIQQSFANVSLLYFEQNYSALIEYSGSYLTCYLGPNGTDWIGNDFRAGSTLWHWRSETLQVTYGPRDIKIDVTGTGLDCSATGNPTPAYHWIDLNTNTTVGNGSHLDICQFYNLALSPATYSGLLLLCTASVANRTVSKDHHINKSLAKSCETRQTSVSPSTVRRANEADFWVILSCLIVAALVFITLTVIIAVLTCTRRKQADSVSSTKDVTVSQTQDGNSRPDVQFTTSNVSDVECEEPAEYAELAEIQRARLGVQQQNDASELMQQPNNAIYAQIDYVLSAKLHPAML